MLYRHCLMESSRGRHISSLLKLRENVLTSFVIMEIPHSNGNDLLYSRCQPERFLADGLIELGVIESAKGMKRYMQIWKMRATKHAMEKQQLLVGDEGIYVLGPIY